MSVPYLRGREQQLLAAIQRLRKAIRPGISEEEFDDLKSDLDAAEEELDQVQLALEDLMDT